MDSSAFQCIICSESFLTRTERNEHLERHFVHRKCSHCDKMVISIGDLDFELHRPVHCRTINDSCKSNAPQSHKLLPTLCIERMSPQQFNDASDNSVELIAKDEEIGAQKFCEIHVVSGFASDINEEDLSPTRKSSRRRTKINYDENDQLIEELVAQTKTSSKKIISKQETKSENRIDAEVIEMLDFENDDGSGKDDADNGEGEGEEEEEEEEGIVFDMKFDELSGDDSDADEGKTDKKQKRFRGKSQVRPKNIPCPDCKLMFRAERTLKSHRKRDHGFVQRNICTICGREFKDTGNLNQHMHTHGDSKRYICNFCGKGFHMPYNLKEHMHQHTGERPYKCSVCEKTFNRQTLRTAHMRVINLNFCFFWGIFSQFIFNFVCLFHYRCTRARNHSSVVTKTAIEPMHIQPT